MLIIDASVAIKWVVTEPGSDAAAALLERGERMAVPELWLAEVGNALWGRSARGLLTVEEAAARLGELLSAPITHLSMAELTPLALEMASMLHHPVYDCCYLAAAQIHDCSLVTADVRFFRRASEDASFGPRVRLLGG